MKQRYIHGIAVCCACDTDLIGQCAICQTGVCNQHIAPNTLEIYLCSECKERMIAMVTAGTPTDPSERKIAELYEVVSNAYEGKTTKGKKIKVYFSPPNFHVCLEPYGIVCYDDEVERNETLQHCLLMNSYSFVEDYKSTVGINAKPKVIKDEASPTSNIEDLESFMHRLLQAGIAYHDVSREGLNYAVSMMSPSLSSKETLDQASKILEKATRNIGISSDQLMQEQQRLSQRHHEVKA